MGGKAGSKIHREIPIHLYANKRRIAVCIPRAQVKRAVSYSISNLIQLVKSPVNPGIRTFPNDEATKHVLDAKTVEETADVVGARVAPPAIASAKASCFVRAAEMRPQSSRAIKEDILYERLKLC
jgi:hypothetical protein